MSAPESPHISDQPRQLSGGDRMTWPKSIVIIVVLFGLYGVDFLYFLLPDAALFSLAMIGLVFWIPLFFHSLEALFKLRWKLISIFAIVWLLLSLRFLGVWAPTGWLHGQGFRVHILMAKDYPSGCKLTEFVEKNGKQMVGFCEGFDRGNYFDFIVYDTTGEFVLPLAQRSPEWKRAMSKATEEGIELKQNAYHLFGNFYAVSMEVSELRG